MIPLSLYQSFHVHNFSPGPRDQGLNLVVFLPWPFVKDVFLECVRLFIRHR